MEIRWLRNRNELLFDKHYWKTLKHLQSGVPLEEIPNVEPNGDGKSCFVYLKNKAGVFCKAMYVRYGAFFVFGSVQYLNYLASLYLLSNTVAGEIMRVCLYLIMFQIFFVVVLKSLECVDFERISCYKSYFNSWKARFV